MEKNEIGISYKIDGSKGRRHPKLLTSLHGAKSVAGKAIKKDEVLSVCVYDATGQVKYYLKKTPNGIYKEVNE